MESGETFLLLNRTDDHLWMVISDTAKDAERIVLVRFLSWRPDLDQACVLNVGDHPFIKHATCVDYPAARIESNAALEQLRAVGLIKVRVPLAQPVLDRIRSKAIDGDIPTECIVLLGKQGLTDYP